VLISIIHFQNNDSGMVKRKTSVSTEDITKCELRYCEHSHIKPCNLLEQYLPVEKFWNFGMSIFGF
jgi:hypothetical protein